VSLFLDRAGGTPGAGLQIVSEALAITEPVVLARMGCIVGTQRRPGRWRRRSAQFSAPCRAAIGGAPVVVQQGINGRVHRGALGFLTVHLPSNAATRRLPGRRLQPGAPAAPGAERLGLLPSGPDPVHGVPPRRTRPSTLRARC